MAKNKIAEVDRRTRNIRIEILLVRALVSCPPKSAFII